MVDVSLTVAGFPSKQSFTTRTSATTSSGTAVTLDMLDVSESNSLGGEGERRDQPDNVSVSVSCKSTAEDGLTPMERVLQAMDREEWPVLLSLLERYASFDTSCPCSSSPIPLVKQMVRLTCQGQSEQGTLLHRVLLQSPTSVPLRIVKMLLQEPTVAGDDATTTTTVARIPDSKGKRLPLHMCLLKGCSLKIAQCILEAYPEATMKADDQGNLPLHYAAMYQNHHVDSKSTGHQEKLFQLILDANPEAAQKANHRERWPLHLLAASCWLESSGVSAMMMPALSHKSGKRRPSLASKFRRSSRRPSATPSTASMASSSRLSHSEQSASDMDFSARDEDSVLAGDGSVSNGGGDDTCYVVRNIEACIKAYPRALECPDRSGFMPLHLACNQRFLRHDVLKVLIEANPSALMIESKTQATPYQLADLIASPSASHGAGPSLMLQYLKESTQQQRKKVSSNPMVRWNIGGISTAATRRKQRRRFAPLRPNGGTNTGVDLYHCYG